MKSFIAWFELGLKFKIPPTGVTGHRIWVRFAKTGSSLVGTRSDAIRAGLNATSNGPQPDGTVRNANSTGMAAIASEMNAIRTGTATI